MPPLSWGKPLGQGAAIEVEVKFVSLTAPALDNLLGYRPKTIAANGHVVWTLSPAERIEVLQRMERQPDAATLSAPRVTTTSARQAQMTVDGIQPILHPRARASAACQVIPYQIGSSLDLAVSAKLTESGDVGSAFGGDLSGNPKEDTNAARSGAKSNQVYAVNAVGYINYEVGTAHTFVGDGGAVILQNPALSGADGRRILVVVSPRVIRLSGSVMKPNQKITDAAPSNSVPVLDDLPLLGRLFRPEARLESPGRRVIPQNGKDPGEELAFKPADETAAADERIKTKEPPPAEPRAELETRVFTFDPKTFFEDAHRFLLDAGLSDIEIFGHSNEWKDSIVRKFCESLDVSRVPPNTIFYTYGTGMLMVRATAEELERVQRAVEKLNALRQNALASPSPAASARVREDKVSRPNAPSGLETNPGERSGNPHTSNAAPSNSVPLLADLPLMGRLFRSQLALTGPGRKAIQAKLDRIVLPEIGFDNVPLLQVISWLAKESTERDPDGTGLNFLANPNVIRVGPEAMFDPNTGNWVTLPQPEPLDMKTVRVRINPPLKNVRLSHALEAIVRTADKPIRYSIEDYGVIFWQNPPGSEADKNLIRLEARIFRVSPATLLEGLKNTSGAPPNSGAIESIQKSVRDFFTAAGVNVQPPNTLFYNHRIGVLMVRATAMEMDIVEKVLETLNYRPPQITIQAKFMELPTEAAMQLGLDLPPPDDRNSNSWTRVLTAAQTRAVLHAADQRVGLDILSAPNVTTLSGRQAQIQQVDIRTVVDGLDPKALAPPGVQSTNGVPAQPYLTSQVACGPTLDVVATVEGDGHTIHLAALPRVTELTQFRPLDGLKELRIWVDGQQQNVPTRACFILTRQMQAAADVYDGQTLVLANPQVIVALKRLGGESLANPVPEETRKRLIVFITANIIDPAGNPIHNAGSEPWADKIPPQPR